MKKLITLALAASAALCLTACATTGPSSDQAASILATAQTVFQATQTVVQQDVDAGLIDAPTAEKLKGYLAAGQQALLAGQAAYAASDAKTEQERVADVMAAVAQINGALLTAYQTAKAK